MERQTLPQCTMERQKLTVTSCRKISTGCMEEIHSEGGSMREQIAQRISVLEGFRSSTGNDSVQPALTRK